MHCKTIFCPIATDKVLVEKQEEIEKLTREKEGEL